VRSATWCEEGPRLRFEITADAFLRGMVRAIVGTLLWVGRGKIDALTFEKIIAANDRAMAGPSAPANGLCLIGVEYEPSGGAAPRPPSEMDEDE
jgi:tRNA pseudouridine38-40 synthase